MFSVSAIKEFFGLDVVPVFQEQHPPVLAIDPTFVPDFNLAACPYTEMELREAFESVRTGHWKNSVDVLVNSYQKERVRWAILAFHGVEPLVSYSAGTYNIFSSGRIPV